MKAIAESSKERHLDILLERLKYNKIDRGSQFQDLRMSGVVEWLRDATIPVFFASRKEEGGCKELSDPR